MSGVHVPTTIDSGADRALIPEELVQPDQFTGTVEAFNGVAQGTLQGKIAKVVFRIAGVDYPREALAVPGEQIFWTAALSLDPNNMEQVDHLFGQVRKNTHLSEEDSHYMPPRMMDGKVQGAVMVSEGTLVGAEEPTHRVTVDPESRSEETEEPVIHAQVEASDAVVAEEQSLVSEQSQPSVSAEAEGVTHEGSGDTGHEGDICVKDIVTSEPRDKLAEATKSDTTLATARALADDTAEGYHWVEGLLFRTRLDTLGDTVEQLCLPTSYRNRCLTLTHESFGHAGRNKMGQHIKRFFYWPSITADAARHIKSCEVCQKKDKTLPRQMMMQTREVVTVPSERVAVDIVGPFPVAKGGFRYLLTYLDMATRWPEAIPLKRTTTRIVINQLTLIFSRNGFPTTLVSDNGPQFIAESFKKFLKEKGIEHIKASPYHLQGNGVIERMHRTLGNIISRCTETKGNWAQVVPMSLYFLRCMPNRSTGMSPFSMKHGWEPATPLQLLYKGWVQHDLGPIDIEEWVVQNSERVQHMRETAVVQLTNTSQQRKKDWDKKAQFREFRKGEMVYLRKSGINTKLADSWAGPYKVEKRNSPLSYHINTGDRVLPSVHVQLLKLHTTRPPEQQVKRVTTVLEPDSLQDTMETQYAEATLRGKVETATRETDIQGWETEFADILTKEPGLTSLVQFRIETGLHPPICQRPYNTPQALVKSVDKELEWLKDKGYIRESSSSWASPMVTVRKPDGTARLCIDFKAINAVTTPLPFYMPRVEEVLERVGKCSVISKIDLTKGYYQVPMHSEDIEKTAFVCHQGKFEFLRMPFGVRNAPAVFQELMHKLFRGCKSFCSPYMDDLIIYSSSWADHVGHVRQVLSCLREAGLTANPAKCHWGGTRMEFLGHLVGEGTMSIPQHRVEALAAYTKPCTKKGLRSFLGAVGFYRRYVEQLAEQTAVLTPLTSKLAPSRVVWTEERELAFSTICMHISQACTLCIPLPEDIFSLVTDASGLGIGAVLQVWRDEQWEAAAFYSRQTKGAEQRYSATELEALALVESIKHFSYYLYGKTFTVYRDHKPLCQLLSSDHLNPRLRRILMKLQHWLLRIEYLPGRENGLADALSREERKRIAPIIMTDASLAVGDVGVPTPT